MPTKKHPKTQTFHEGEIKYLLSRAIRYGVCMGKQSVTGAEVLACTDEYINEVLPSFMSKTKPTVTLGNETYHKVKKTSKSHDDYEENQLRLYTNMYGK